MCSGNEALLDSNGYGFGSNIIINNGCMSTSNGPNKGISKALAQSFGLLIFDTNPYEAFDWSRAWTPLDILQVKMNRIPILMTFALGLDSSFWVSHFDFQILFLILIFSAWLQQRRFVELVHAANTSGSGK